MKYLQDKLLEEVYLHQKCKIQQPPPLPLAAPTADAAPGAPDRKKFKFAKTAQVGNKLETSPNDDNVSPSNSRRPLIAKPDTKSSNIENKKIKKPKPPKVILLDSGANVICLSESYYFNKLWL